MALAGTPDEVVEPVRRVRQVPGVNRIIILPQVPGRDFDALEDMFRLFAEEVTACVSSRAGMRAAPPGGLALGREKSFPVRVPPLPIGPDEWAAVSAWRPPSGCTTGDSASIAPSSADSHWHDQAPR